MISVSDAFKSIDNINWFNVIGYDGTATNYQDAGLTNGNTYYYRMVSTSPDFNDSNYGYASAIPQAAPVGVFDNTFDNTFA